MSICVFSNRCYTAPHEKGALGVVDQLEGQLAIFFDSRERQTWTLDRSINGNKHPEVRIRTTESVEQVKGAMFVTLG